MGAEPPQNSDAILACFQSFFPSNHNRINAFYSITCVKSQMKICQDFSIFCIYIFNSARNSARNNARHEGDSFFRQSNLKFQAISLIRHEISCEIMLATRVIVFQIIKSHISVCICNSAETNGYCVIMKLDMGLTFFF